MYATQSNLFETVYNIVLNSGNNHNCRDFSINILYNMASACPFDQARIYFFNDNGKVSDQFLLGADIKWANAYHEYYSKLENGRYSAYKDVNESLRPNNQKVSTKTWEGSELTNNEFYQDYVRPQGIKCTIAFTLFDATGDSKAIFMLDRVTRSSYSEEELQVVQLAYPQLNNLHKNFFSNCNSVNKLEHINWQTTALTPREIDVTALLCQGVSPANVSKKLHIALPTVNKHISHIYAKMNVSSRQELLVRIMNQ